jgi:hypothetical protein
MAENKVDTRLPLSLHEAVIAKHFQRDPHTREPIEDAVLAGMHDAMRRGREAAEASLDAHDKIMKNMMKTPIDNARRARKVAFERFDAAAREIDKARAKGEAEIARIEAATSSPGEPKSTADAFQREAIRNVLASMAPEKRAQAVETAIEDDDRDVLIAAFTGPVMLTGLGKAEREALRERWRHKHYPAELDRVKRLKAAIADLSRGGTLLLEFVDGLTDADAIKHAEQAEASALAASKVA